MTEHQIAKIHKSWQLITSKSTDVGGLFYSRLFELMPDTRALFTSDIDQQSSKFVQTMTFILAKLYSGHAIISDVEYLSNRHKVYGVKPEHYAKVGEALIWALQKSMKNEWNDDLLLMWKTMYDKLAEAMIKSAEANKS